MHSQIYLSGRLVGNPDLGTTKKGRLWYKVLLECDLVREGRPGEFVSEKHTLPISFFSHPAETIKGLKVGDCITVGCHLSGTSFQPDIGTVRHGVQLVADAVFVTKEAPAP